MLTAITLSWASAVACVATWAALRARFASRINERSPANDAAHVVLLRPCAGHEPWLADALASSRAVGPSARIRFLIASSDDAARAACFAASDALHEAGYDARTLVTGASAPNRKADQLARALKTENVTNALVVVADSDVQLDARALTAVLGPLARSEADACFLPPLENAPRTWADRASAALLDGSLHAFAVLAQLDPRGMVGKLFAIRGDALAAVGGFDVLVASLGEDMLLARLLTDRGYRVVAGADTADARASGRDVHAVMARYARWVAVIRAQRPALLVSYPLLFASTPGMLAFAGAAFIVGEGRAAGLGLAGVVIVRAWVLVVARRLSRRSIDGSGDALMSLLFAFLADFVLLAAFVRAMISRRVTWRGVALTTRGAQLHEADT